MDIPVWHETLSAYMRGINHLNLVKTIIVKTIGFRHMNRGEDITYSNKLMESKKLKSQFLIKHPTYLYYFVFSKPENTPVTASSRSTLGLNYTAGTTHRKTFNLFGGQLKR
jgi:hypothetical protein